MAAFEPLAEEDDTGIGGRGAQAQAGGSSRMNADALKGHGRAKGRLPVSHHTLIRSLARRSSPAPGGATNLVIDRGSLETRDPEHGPESVFPGVALQDKRRRRGFKITLSFAL
jgi:hypothetical protein